MWREVCRLGRSAFLQMVDVNLQQLSDLCQKPSPRFLFYKLCLIRPPSPPPPPPPPPSALHPTSPHCLSNLHEWLRLHSSCFLAAPSGGRFEVQSILSLCCWEPISFSKAASIKLILMHRIILTKRSDIWAASPNRGDDPRQRGNNPTSRINVSSPFCKTTDEIKTGLSLCCSFSCVVFTVLCVSSGQG